MKLIRLIQEAGGLKKPEEKNRLYKDHPKGFYVYAKFKSNDNDSKNSKDIQGCCVNYFIRYAGRPAMAENRITEYNKESNTVSWFYNDHKDEKRHDVTDNVIDFINRLIIHIIHSRTKEMTVHTEKDILMKCTKLGYEEEAPR